MEMGDVSEDAFMSLDEYCRRVCQRTGVLEPGADDIRPDIREFLSRYHAQRVGVGRASTELLALLGGSRAP